MNETEENKTSEKSEENQSGTEQSQNGQSESAQSVEVKQQDLVDPTASTGESEAEPEAPKEEKEVSAQAKTEEPQAPQVEEKEASTETEKPEPVRTRQPSMMDEPLNISEDKQWYVVQAFSGYEASVKRSLLERIERAGLGNDFGEILVPTEEVVEIRGGQKRRSERKFFPGYVLVQMDLNDETWHLVKNVPRVLGFIGGTADRPAPISAKEADAILQRVQDGVDKPQPKVLFDVGEVVRVTDGPFNDFNGVVEEVNFEKNKLLVAVQIFGRSTPVELEFSQVEKA